MAVQSTKGTRIHHEKELTQEQVNRILGITEKDVTSSLIKELFSRKPDGSDPEFRTNDFFKLPTYVFDTKREVWTTVGIYIMNVFLLRPKFADFFGYYNKPLTGKNVAEIENKLANLLYTDQISADDLADFFNRIQWLGGNKIMTILSPSLTSALLTEPKEVIEERDKLFAKHASDLADDSSNNAEVSAMIEKELVKMTEDYIKNQDGAENFESKAKINISNNFKNMNVLKGATKNSYTGSYRVNKSNYNSGISKSEYSSFADSSVFGSHARAINTAEGGYMTKEVNQALQHIYAAPKGTDCMTQKTLTVKLFKAHKSQYMYRYIVDNGKLVELTPDNWSQYEDREVQLRSPLYCRQEEPCYCNVCLGNQPYMLNLINLGLAVSRVPNKLVTLSMKSFHDSSVKTQSIPLDEIFIF